MFFKIHYLLLILFLAPLMLFQMDYAYAVPPTVVSVDTEVVSPADALTTTITISDVVVGSELNRLLVVGVALDNTIIPSTSTNAFVVSVNFGPTGSSCSTNQSLSLVSGSDIQDDDDVRNEIWSLTSPTQSQTCDVIVTLSDGVGSYSTNPFDKRSAVATSVLFSGVDQTTPIVGNTGITNFDTSSTPSVTIVSTADQHVMDIMSAIHDVAPVLGPNQILGSSFFTSGLSLDFLMGTSTQLGNLDTTMSWTLTSSANWVSSAIVINSCDVSASCTILASSSSGCSGDCVAPTLGLDKLNNLIIKNGFAFNENFSDVDLYYTFYPLITTNVGEENTLSLIIYENSGPENIAHVGVAFGLGEGEMFNESKAVINWDRSFDGIETLSVIDPDGVLENIRTQVEEKDCEEINSQCLYITIYHTFRESLEFNMVSTYIWDHDRNAWQNYFNSGIQIIGESLNPQKEYDGTHKGKIYRLTETQKNKSIDGDGNSWTLEKSVWIKDYVPTKKIDSDLVNYEKIWAIKHVLKDQSFDNIFEAFVYDRNQAYFVIKKNYQILLAENLRDEFCPKCNDEPYDKIDDIFFYEFLERVPRINSISEQHMKYESEKASNILQEMIDSRYPGKVFD